MVATRSGIVTKHVSMSTIRKPRGRAGKTGGSKVQTSDTQEVFTPAVPVAKPAESNVEAEATETAKQSTGQNGTAHEKIETKEDDAYDIVIEACKQCNSFKTRAEKLKSLSLKARPHLKIAINPEKPRKGYFEVRTKTKTILSLPNMKRPFPPLKALVIEDVAQQVISQLPGGN